MRVLLIEPPAENTIVSNNPPIIDDERGCNPPLGILYLAGYMEQMSDHEAGVLDCPVEGIGHIETRHAVSLRELNFDAMYLLHIITLLTNRGTDSVTNTCPRRGLIGKSTPTILPITGA